jgi:cephalosporin hydroxylase
MLTAMRPAAHLYQYDLIFRTGNFATLSWAGVPIWQNILDLWTLQETIVEVRPDLVVEIGTHQGGSARFCADLMEVLGTGEVLTIDIEKLHELDHPRISFLYGDSVDPDIVSQVWNRVEGTPGPVMVILDGDHNRDHVSKELELYAPMVTPGSFLLSQDGIIDKLWIFRGARPGPLEANRDFLARHPEFELDEERTDRFGLSHHPLGWMRRIQN